MIRVRLQLNPSTLRYFGSGVEDTLSSSSKRKIARSRSLTAFMGNQSFTESLILAQDERWRRA